MLLKPEEVEHIRQEELARLKKEEELRQGAPDVPQGSTPRMEDHEGMRLARLQEQRKLRRSIEEEYWTERGYQKYVTRHGKTLWLTPDEYRERKARRRKRSKKSRNSSNDFILRQRLQKAAMYLGILLLGILLGLQLV